MKKGLNVLLFVCVTALGYRSLLGMEQETFHLLDEEATTSRPDFILFVKNGNIEQVVSSLELGFVPNFVDVDTHLTPLGIACERLSANIRSFDTGVKSAWLSCYYCRECYLEMLAKKIELFKKMIVLLAKRIRPNLSDQISIQLALRLLRGMHEDKIFSCILCQLLPPSEFAYGSY